MSVSSAPPDLQCCCVTACCAAGIEVVTDDGVVQAEAIKKDESSSLPDKAAASDFFSEGTMIVDSADSAHWKILWMNPVCSQLLGKLYCHTMHGSISDATAGIYTVLHMAMASQKADC